MLKIDRIICFIIYMNDNKRFNKIIIIEQNENKEQVIVFNKGLNKNEYK